MEPLTEQDVRHILADALEAIAEGGKNVDRFKQPKTDRFTKQKKSETAALLDAITKQAEKLRRG